MKKLLTGALITAMCVVPVEVAGAAPPDAADFAADCNADGNVVVASTTRYVGGVGVLTAGCQVEVAPGATLVFRDVDLSGSDYLVVTDPAGTVGGANSAVRIIDSVIDVAGVLQVSPGCCAGDGLVDDQAAKVVVKNSSLRADLIDLTTSFDWPDGVIRIISSDLTATSTTFPFAGISVQSSPVGGSYGRTRVIDSSFDAPTGTLLEASAGLIGGGRIAVRDSQFTGGPVTITAGAAGASCRSIGNTPSVACTP